MCIRRNLKPGRRVIFFSIIYSFMIPIKRCFYRLPFCRNIFINHYINFSKSISESQQLVLAGLLLVLYSNSALNLLIITFLNIFYRYERFSLS